MKKYKGNKKCEPIKAAIKRNKKFNTICHIFYDFFIKALPWHLHKVVQKLYSAKPEN